MQRKDCYMDNIERIDTMSDLDYYKSEVERYSKKVEEESEKAKVKELAEGMHAIYSAFLEAGFSEEQAWWVTGTIFYKKAN